jgi:hypothetical protein
MHSQLEQNTRLSELLLKDIVTNTDISEMLDEIWEQYKDVKVKNGTDEKSLNNPYTNIQDKLKNNVDITKLSAEELDTVIEILRNIDKTFRTYGKRAVGFGNYMTKSIQRRRSLK